MFIDWSLTDGVSDFLVKVPRRPGNSPSANQSDARSRVLGQCGAEGHAGLAVLFSEQAEERGRRGINAEVRRVVYVSKVPHSSRVADNRRLERVNHGRVLVDVRPARRLPRVRL